MTEKVPFANLPFETRMAFRDDLDDLGCDCATYTGDGILVSVGRWPDLLGLLVNSYGWHVASVHYFPLCSDNPEPHLRHAVPGRYNGSRGFWLRALVLPWKNDQPCYQMGLGVVS